MREGGGSRIFIFSFSCCFVLYISYFFSSLTFHHWRGQQARGATRFGIGISGATGEHRVKGATSLRSRDLTGGVGDLQVAGVVLIVISFHLYFLSFI